MIFGKLGYLNFRSLYAKGSEWVYEYTFYLNGIRMFNEYSWVDFVLSHSKSSVQDCDLVSDGGGCHMQTRKSTSDDVKLSGFVVFEIA